MKSLRILLIATTAVLALAGCSSKSIKPIENGNILGVVLMHGKGGGTKWVDPLASNLRSTGVQVVTPAMPWHRRRIYDKTFEASMLEIQKHVRKLKSDGAISVFVAGHSLGAIAAAGYGARYEDIQGIILLAPGHFTDWGGFHGKFVGDLKKADSMIDSGQGDKKSRFGDINAGKTSTRYTTAKIYMSWFSPIGPAEFVSNMANLKGNIPVLYVAGSRDYIPQTQNREYAFDRAPENEGV
jgi:esterase/lipase